MDARNDVLTWKKATFDAYESLAGRYAAKRDDDPKLAVQLTIASDMLHAEQGRTLDLGCGTGSAFAMLRAREFEVVGIDLSSRMVAFAKQRHANDRDIQVSRGDAEFLPFADASFDVVTCLGMFESLPDYIPAMREIARVLRPGGLLVLSVPNQLSPYHVAHDVAQATVWRAWRTMKTMRRRGPAATASPPAMPRRPCIPSRLRAELARCGLAPERDAYTNFLVYPFDWLWPRANDILSRLLTRMSVVRIVAATGCQYMVAARKAAVRLIVGIQMFDVAWSALATAVEFV
jgi:SAM-dependent methyltransferase